MCSEISAYSTATLHPKPKVGSWSERHTACSLPPFVSGHDEKAALTRPYRADSGLDTGELWEHTSVVRYSVHQTKSSRGFRSVRNISSWQSHDRRQVPLSDGDLEPAWSHRAEVGLKPSYAAGILTSEYDVITVCAPEQWTLGTVHTLSRVPAIGSDTD